MAEVSLPFPLHPLSPSPLYPPLGPLFVPTVLPSSPPPSSPSFPLFPPLPLCPRGAPTFVFGSQPGLQHTHHTLPHHTRPRAFPLTLSRRRRRRRLSLRLVVSSHCYCRSSPGRRRRDTAAPAQTHQASRWLPSSLSLLPLVLPCRVASRCSPRQHATDPATIPSHPAVGTHTTHPTHPTRLDHLSQQSLA